MSRRALRAHAIVLVALASVGALPGVASSQGGRARDSLAPRPMSAGRPAMERRLRQELWRITKQRVGLSDDQMTRLEGTAQRFDGRRRALNQEERAQRQLLRRELAAPSGGDQGRVGEALDRVLQLQRSRFDLMAEEQRELATFLSPVERAKFTALQEQLRRRAAAMRAQRQPDAP